MLLVVDASALVAELLRERGRKLLTDIRLELAVTDAQWSETQHELTRRLMLLAERNRLSTTTAEELLQTGLELAASNLVLFEKTSWLYMDSKGIAF